MGVQARQIVRAARKLNINLEQVDYQACATAVMSRMVGEEITVAWYDTEKREEMAKKFGLSAHQVDSIEVGFEGPGRTYILRGRPAHKTYLKVGQRVAKMVGLPVY